MEADDLDNLIADSLGGVQSALDSERKAATAAPASSAADAAASKNVAGEAVRELQQGPARPDDAGEGQPPNEEFFSNLVKTFQDENFQKAMASVLQGADATAGSSAAGTGAANSLASSEKTDSKLASEAVAKAAAPPEASGGSTAGGSTASGSEAGVEDFLQNFLKSFDKAVGSDGNFEKSLTSLMTSMLSNDLICEPLQQLADKLEPWLKNHKSLSSSDRERYEAQLRTYQQILQIYRGSSDPLPDSARDEVQRLFSELHGLGEPPEEVMKQISPKDAEEGGSNFEDFMKSMGLDSDLGAAEKDLLKKLAEDPEELTNVMKGMAEGAPDEACNQQ